MRKAKEGTAAVRLGDCTGDKGGYRIAEARTPTVTVQTMPGDSAENGTRTDGARCNEWVAATGHHNGLSGRSTINVDFGNNSINDTLDVTPVSMGAGQASRRHGPS